MLGLRFFACNVCETVMAAPVEPSQCHDCHDEDIAEISEMLQSDAYFTRAQN
ncbi:hypothetical protein [Haloquadratum walsbyi]|jgi:formate dehydrogenase maturation protein FdhE|uniref:Small CPxCG-related zinc finger protein n=2 Tax=Haloquadratum walsbyi TaxID=293091 RepID=Q18K77_HALWD|nr:hypothetical protein [Haloquadratum walsbyi]CAJ51574.1 uncharacterized protein HQ_1446A [Haloquadratum walsbyi DSM 16790]CCC39472.1 uncharacterized protein Hqrw_1527 [Haloquadratum walsbyi C23]